MLQYRVRDYGADSDWVKVSRNLRRGVGHCQICYCSWPGPLQVHHKNKNPFDDRRENLIVLCDDCHNIVHFGKSKYGSIWAKDGNGDIRIIYKELHHRK